MNTLVEHANEFNDAIKYLARVYALKKKGTFEEEKALRNNKRLSIVVASDPIWPIQHCGPFFLKYADLIQDRKWGELLKQEFTEEKEKYKSSDDGKKHSFNAMDSKIKFIKRVFTASDGKEREALGDKLQTMLSAYCKYALQVKVNTSC